jgi:predicted polyphosphate/ATP-dependent NAD kinase
MKLASLEAEAETEQQRGIAKHVVEEMEPDVLYLLGPGTTTRAVTEALGEEKTLLGVDVIQNKRVVARDLNEKQLLGWLEGRRGKIIVSPIGGQGFIFGRGNQQLSPEVIRRVGKDNVRVLATPRKLATTPALRVDTGDAKLDEEFRGYVRVVVGYRQIRMVKVF